ncbi:uncharacterized protein [Asterias amurensis]|uniref:uncharacterized protein n=1 Tax=Asterias amurensis TaxID=7602 RepID=UPI003AB1E2D1
MATSGITNQSMINTASEDQFECPICSDRYTDPRVLDCMHSFCYKCLCELQKSQVNPKKSKLSCPLCRRQTSLTVEGVAGLLEDLKLSAAMDEFAFDEQVIRGQSSSIKCQACDDDKEKAVSRCMQCDHFLCPECQAQHTRMTLMKSHQIFTLAQFQSGKVIYKSKIREYVPKCKRHTDQSLNIYCETCQELKCTTCSILGHGSKEHSLVDLPEAIETCKQEVGILVWKVKQNMTDLTKVIKDADKSQKKMYSLLNQTNDKISKRAEKEFAKIKEMEQKVKKDERKLKQEADKTYQDKAKVFDAAQKTNKRQLKNAEYKLNEVHRLMTQGSQHEILSLKQKILHNLNELTDLKPENMPNALGYLDFEENEQSLGRIVLEEMVQQDKDNASTRSTTFYPKWKLKEVILGPTNKRFSCKQSIATFSNNHIVAVDTAKNQLITFTPYSVDTLKKLNLIGLANPILAVVNKDDHLIVIDKQRTTYVKIFSKKQRLMGQFLPGGRINNDPTCLAVDENNLIAVGYMCREEITLHNPDGSFIIKLLAPGITGYMTMYNQRLIYTNWEKSRLISVNYNGSVVFTVDLIDLADKEKWKPTGVVCARDGSIYVAVRTCKLSTTPATIEIQQFSSDGKYIGCIAVGSRYMYGMTSTSSGDLVVAAEDCLEIYEQEI